MRLYWHIGNYRYPFYQFFFFHIFNRVKANKLILDAGCGEAGSVEATEFVGVDIERSNIIEIKRKRIGNFVVADVAFLPFKAECFGTIICKDVLEHVKNKNFALTEIARVAQPNAYFIGCTTNLLNPLMMLDSSSKWFCQIFAKYVGEGYYERHTRLTPSKLTKLLRQASFKVNLYMIAFPPFKFLFLYLCEYKNKEPTWYAHLWIVFTKLTYRLKILREVMLFEAIKQQD